MWPVNSSESSYAPTSFLGSFCNTISSCLGLLCCCWLCQDCLGRQRRYQQGPTTPLIGPPPGLMDDRLGGPHSPYGMSNLPSPPHPMHHHHHEHLGGPHRPSGMLNPPGPPGLVDDRLTQLGGPHSPFGVSNPPGPPGLIGHHHEHPHGPFGMSDPPGPPGPPIQHSSLGQHGPPHSHETPGVPKPPRVPSVQPGLL